MITLYFHRYIDASLSDMTSNQFMTTVHVPKMMQSTILYTGLNLIAFDRLSNTSNDRYHSRQRTQLPDNTSVHKITSIGNTIFIRTMHRITQLLLGGIHSRAQTQITMNHLLTHFRGSKTFIK